MAKEMVAKKPTEAEIFEAKEKQDNMFMSLAAEMQTGLGKAIADKTPIENRMLADEAQYWGAGHSVYDEKDDLAGPNTRATSRSGTVDNKTRSKTRIASARIGDMLFPTNSPNWALRPTPYPDVDIDLVMEEWKKEQALNAPPAQAGGVPDNQSLMSAMPPDQSVDRA